MHAAIRIYLPKDRFKPGILEYYTPWEERLLVCDCLGRSAGILDKLTGAVRRDPLQFRGNTPLGGYATTFVSHLPKPVLGIGSLWIPIDPVSGDALKAEQNGRTGLGIHGGRGNGALKPTHGCIRLRDKDMAELARIAGKTRFTVDIRER